MFKRKGKREKQKEFITDLWSLKTMSAIVVVISIASIPSCGIIALH